MFARHNKTFRHTIRQYRPGTTGRRTTSQRPINFSKNPTPPEKGPMAVLRRLITRYKEIRHAKRLPCQLLWNFFFGPTSDSRKPLQGAGNLSGMGTTTIWYFFGMPQTKETTDKGLHQEKSGEAQAQEGRSEDTEGVEDDMGNVEEVEEDVEGSEERIDGDAEAQEIGDGVERLEAIEEDIKDADRIGDVEDGVEDREDLEEEDHDFLKGVEEDDEAEVEEVGTVGRSLEEAHDVEKRDEKNVKEDGRRVKYIDGNLDDEEYDADGELETVEEAVDGHCEDVEESAERAVEEVQGDYTDKKLSEARMGEVPREEDKGFDIHVYDTGTMNAKTATDESGQSQSAEATSTQSQAAEPPMEEKPNTGPVYMTPTVMENNNLQLMPISEDVRRILSRMATSTHYRPKRTALGTRNFITYVLSPRGIQIDTDEPKTESAFEHFNSAEPPPGSNVYEHYRQRNGLRSSTVWINPTADVIQSIHNNYSEMHHSIPNALCEPEWVDDAVKYLLKSEPRSQLQPKPSNSPQWLPVRMREESFRPQDGGVWEMPPVVHHDMPVDPTFNFNVQPDCSYWIWAGGFRPAINEKLTSLASVRFRRSLCPYLTIEVKKDARNSGKGRQQIATAASTALYNRWKLKERYLRKTGSSFSKARLSDVRHYGLLLAGVRYEVWSLRPHGRVDASHYSTNSWTGCSMRRIHSGDLDTTTGIKDYINWINEIHCRGNTRHSSDCVRDIEGRLLPEEKALTSTLARLALVKRDGFWD